MKNHAFNGYAKACPLLRSELYIFPESKRAYVTGGMPRTLPRPINAALLLVC